MGLAAVRADREKIALSEVRWCLYIPAQDKIYASVSREWKTSLMELLMLIYNCVLYNISNRNY